MSRLPVGADFLSEVAATAPDRVAIDDGATLHGFGALDAAVADYADQLRAIGVGPGRCVVVEAEATLPTVVVLHAVLRTGALLAPIHPSLPARARATVTRTLRPVGVIEAHALDGGGLAPPDPAALLDTSSDGAAIAYPPGAAAVVWTSGTTGTPRGVWVRGDALRASASGVRQRLGLGADDRWFASLSPAHIGGLALLTRASLLGCRVVLRGRFDVDELDGLITNEAITHASLVPTMLRRLLDRRRDRPPPASLLCLLLGGAHTPADLLGRAVDAGYPIALTYGMTEATSQVATAPPDLVRRKPGTVGRPLPGVEVRIGDGVDSAPHEAGRIHVRGETVSPGVTEGPSLTDRAGWFATDDVGYFDADGDLWITGRRSHRIISGGVNVDPHEVEAVLRGHPAIADACVVAHPHPTWGEVAVALVVPSDAAAIDLDTIEVWTRSELSAAQRPKRIRLAETLPLNRNGKVDRSAVAQQFDDDGEPKMDEDRFRELMSHWASTVGILAVRDDDRVHGTTVTSFTPVSTRPPRVLASLGPNAQTLPFLDPGTEYTVSLLHDEQAGLAQRFADPYPVGPSPFPVDGPPIVENALVRLVCRVAALVPVEGGGRLVLGEVVDGADEPDRRPLLWFRRASTRLAPE